jgi:hypothetical protein
MNFGSKETPLGGRIRVLAVPATSRGKVGGVTIDWATVAAVSGSPVTIDGQVIPVGKKFLPFGTVLVQITASRLYGPAQTNAGGATAATDGRQTIDATRRGAVFVLDRTITEDDDGQHIGEVFDTGVAYKARIKCGGNGQATYLNLEAALPGLTYASS